MINLESTVPYRAIQQGIENFTGTVNQLLFATIFTQFTGNKLARNN